LPKKRNEIDLHQKHKNPLSTTRRILDKRYKTKNYYHKSDEPIHPRSNANHPINTIAIFTKQHKPNPTANSPIETPI
ncbi:hypothetical protein AAHH78_43715, partial [Burkholderia pseudomallei]